jgi:hypothetical protein
VTLAARVLCALLCALPALRQSDAAEAVHRPFPTPPRALTLAWEGDGPTVVALLAAYADATGRLVLMSHGTREAIRQRIAGIESGAGRIDVPREAVHAVFEARLVQNQLVLSEAFAGAKRSAVRVTSLRTGELWTLVDHLPLVPVDSIDVYRGHPAVLVETWVPVAPGVDAPSLSTALQGALPDMPDVQRFAAAGQGVVVRGFGPDVCTLVEFVREVNALHADNQSLDAKAMRALAEQRLRQPAEEPR